MAPDRYVRPDPLHWLWYAVGGGLPPRYRAWVGHDVTAPGGFRRSTERRHVNDLRAQGDRGRR